ncbi:MAG: MFS transporter [Bacilli bacterium]|nr:MFS transporter [Bacilli bacterium]
MSNKINLFQRISNRVGQTYSGQKIPRGTKWTYSVSGTFRDAAYALMSAFVIVYAKEAGIIDIGSAAILGAISAVLIAFRVFDAVNDPIMGVIIERVHFKTGKYKPWIFIGSFISMITYLALFCGPKIFPWCRDWVYVGWFAVFYLLWDIGFTMNDIAYWSMLPSMSSVEKERAQVTSIVLFCCNIGEFVVTALTPFLTQTNILGTDAYWVICLIVTGLFIISQTCVFIFCKERSRNLLDRKAEKPASVKDLFNVLKNNSQVRTMIIVILLYYISIHIINGLMNDVLWITAGYNEAKQLQFYFTFVNTAAVLLPPVFIPLLLKKFSLRKIANVGLVGMLATRIIFLFYGSPIGNNLIAPPQILGGGLGAGYATCFCILSALMVLSQTIAYNIFLIMMSNTIEYNEYKTGDRQESIIFSLRPFSTKLSSSIKEGVVFVALLATGINKIEGEIGKINDSPLSPAEKEAEITKVLQTVTASQVWGLKLIMVIIPLLCIITCYLLIRKYYFIDEKYYAKICDEIDKRNKKDLKEAKAK